jgi:DNA uptake protein ComE-like DNA-binding protein
LFCRAIVGLPQERRRPFQFVEELTEVIGIGPIICDAIKDLVTIGQS